MSEIIPTYNIVFLRHGESVGNAEDRFQGQADFPLTEKGRDQAKVRAERWLAEGVTFDKMYFQSLAARPPDSGNHHADIERAARIRSGLDGDQQRPARRLERRRGGENCTAP